MITTHVLDTAAGRPGSRYSQLAPDRGAALVDDDFMPGFGRDTGCLEPAGASARDDDAPPGRGS